MSSRARELRRRMSIDPDAPDPVARPTRTRPARPAPVPPEPTTPAEPESPEPTTTAPPEPATTEPPEPPTTEPPASGTAEPPTPTRPTRQPSREPSTEPTAEPPRQAARQPVRKSTPTQASSPGTRSTPRRRRRSRADDPGWTTALDDPAIDPDRNGYRSFYVSDAVFARFRAAVYWTARRPDATGVPDNMSSGVEAYMEEVAADLERRYNDGAVFRPTPDQLRAHRRREGGT